MSKNNFFFSLTGTEEQYTEQYLNKVIADILKQEGLLDFTSLYEKILALYPGIKLNRSAILKYAVAEFKISLSNKATTHKKIKPKKSNYFFGLQNSDKRHTEEHLLQEIEEVLKNTPLRKEELFDEIVKRYNNEKINFSAFMNLVEGNFLYRNKKYQLNPDNQIFLFDTELKKDAKYILQQSQYMSALQKYVLYSNEELYKELYSKLEEPDSPIMDVVLPTMATEIKKGSQDVEKCADICIRINRNSDYYLEKIEAAIRNIGIENKELACSTFINNKSVQKLLGAHGILTAADFAKISPKIALILSCIDLEGAIAGIESLAEGYSSKMKDAINEAISNALKDRTHDVLLRRYGNFTGREDTLEELGAEYGLTRERVRQIESKGKQKLSTYALDVRSEVKGYFDLLIKSDGVSYRRIQELLNASEDQDTIYNACLLLEPANINYKYDGKYHLVYDSDVITVDDIEKQIIDEYGKLFAVSRYDAASEFEKEIIEKNYALSGRQHNLYRLRRYNQSDFLIDLVAELFPDGYRQYNEDDYTMLAEEYANRLGDDVEVPSIAAVRGIIGRDVFCQIDKGTYKLRRECAEIPVDIFNRIFDFIVDHLPAVDYVTIYENFENELNKLGINNYYYMKGVIDYSLPDDLTTKRNYITETDNRVSVAEARIAFMRSFPGIFTVEDLQKKYQGVKPYVFQFLCYDEAKNGLVQIGRKKFIYSEKLNISEIHITKIKEVVENLFKNTDTKILSARKVYAKIKLSYPDLLEDLPFIEDQFSMFSIIKYLYANDYYLDRPYISKEEPDTDRITTRGIILRYLEKHEKIDYERYRNYCMKMNIPMIYTYMQLVDELSDNYVQINDRQMIRKEEFDIHERALQDIERTLELIFSKMDKINTAAFNGYMMLPPIKYKWNKHVLAGIIRSYFSEKYEVINITEGSKSEAIDYEIERYVA